MGVLLVILAKEGDVGVIGDNVSGLLAPKVVTFPVESCTIGSCVQCFGVFASSSMHGQK